MPRWFKLKSILATVALCLVATAGLHLSFTGPEKLCQNLATATRGSDVPPLPAAAESSIPKATDWVDYGPIFEAGGEGAWDFNLNWLASVVKKNDTYFLYYVGSDGYRSDDGEAARHRAIGLATSPDGIHFTKYPSNPVMTHAPFNGEEEGANSAGLTVNTEGDFVMYYGAAVGPKDQINADGRVAVSKDGFAFTDLARVLDHRSPLVHRFVPDRFRGAHPFVRSVFHPSALHGHGDEIFPVASFEYKGSWHVYYMPNGGTAPRTLGLAWGPNIGRLPCSVKVLDGSWKQPVRTWGNVIRLGPDKIALFVQKLWWPDTFVEVRTASPEAPHQLSEPVEKYNIPDLKFGTIFLDVERRTWLMYYATFDRFLKLRLAPAGDRDKTPPTMPAGVSAVASVHDKVELSWKPAHDPDTGVVRYNIYRNGRSVGSTKNHSFKDSGLAELTRYVYDIAPVNFHGVEGPAVQRTVTTVADTAPPTILSAVSNVDPSKITVVFSEPVAASSARKVANYSIDHGLKIEKVSLDADLRIATLTTSPHQEGVTYTLVADGILDRASTPNRINPTSRVIYTYSSIPGMVGYWTFDQGRAPVVSDRSGSHNDGYVHKAIWNDKGLTFDGKQSHVLIPNSSSLKDVTNKSFTFVALVKPYDVPQSANGYGILLRVGSHPNSFFGLSYLSDKKFYAQLNTDRSDAPTRVSSKAVDPGVWRHVAMVVDTDAKILTLYLNGEPVPPMVFTGSLQDLHQDATANHFAGEYYIGSTKADRGAGSFFARHFRGQIAEARIYDRALNLAAIRSLFAMSTEVGIKAQ
jgi:hypothetical protein